MSEGKELTDNQKQYFFLIQRMLKNFVYITAFALLKPKIYDLEEKNQYKVRLGRYTYNFPKYEWTVRGLEKFNEKLDKNIDFEKWSSGMFVKHFLRLKEFLKKDLK